MLNKIKPWVNTLVVIVLLGFIIIFIKETDFSKLANLDLNIGFLLLSAIIALLFRYWGAYIWVFILRQLGAHDLRLNAKLATVYSQAWLGRYIPGTAPWILGKIYFASAHGISKRKLAVGALLEGALQVVTLLSLSLFVLIFESKLDIFNTELKLFLAAVAIAIAIIIYPPVFNRAIIFAAKKTKKINITPADLPSNMAVLKAAGLYAIGFFLSGLSYFFLAKSIYPATNMSDLLFVVGAFNLAGALGMVAIFTPSGLGVREGVLLLLLKPLMPAGIVVVLVVLARVWGLAIDGLFFVFSKLADFIITANSPKD